MTAVSGDGWNLAPSLVTLLREVDAVWPDRKTYLDGAKGDQAHSERESDHNPNSRGIVNALDITNEGVSVDAIIEAASMHPSTAYIISRGLIYSDWMNFEPRPFPGDPHDRHVHISINQSVSAENNTAPWGVEEEIMPLSDEDVKRIADAVWAKVNPSLTQINSNVWRAIAAAREDTVVDVGAIAEGVANAIVDDLGESMATEVLDAMSQRLAV